MIEGTCPYCGHDRFWELTRRHVECANCGELIEADILNKDICPECLSFEFAKAIVKKYS